MLIAILHEHLSRQFHHDKMCNHFNSTRDLSRSPGENRDNAGAVSGHCEERRCELLRKYRLQRLSGGGKTHGLAGRTNLVSRYIAVNDAQTVCAKIDTSEDARVASDAASTGILMLIVIDA